LNPLDPVPSHALLAKPVISYRNQDMVNKIEIARTQHREKTAATDKKLKCSSSFFRDNLISPGFLTHTQEEGLENELTEEVLLGDLQSGPT
jgi:hypothetical protein